MSLNSSPISNICFLFLALSFSSLAAAENICQSHVQTQAIQFLQKKLEIESEDKIAKSLLAAKFLERYRKEHNPDDIRSAEELFNKSGPKERTLSELIQYAAILKAEHRFTEGIELRTPFVKSFTETKAGIEPSMVKSAKLLLIDFYTELGQTKEAFALISRLALPGDELLLREARLAELRGDNEEVISKLKTYAEQVNDPLRFGFDAVWAKLQVSDALVRLGRIDQASGFLNEAASICPDYWGIIERRAELKAMQGKFEDAVSVYTSLAKEHPIGPLFETTAALLRMTGNMEQAKVFAQKAQDFYRKAREKNEIMYLHHEVSLLADLMDKPCDALELARQDLKMRVTWQTLEAAAWSAYGCGQTSTAKEKIEEALRLNSKTPHLLYRAGIILNGIGEWKRGKNLINEARRKNPWVAAFHAHR